MTRAWYDLSGKVALVIGASKGLGRESALALAEAGADVACAARSRDALVAVAGAIKEKGHRSFFTVADVTAEESIRNGVGAVSDHFGRIDILV
jgi:NAD(P)-dependent dehydrogenase (short-subunit alcohol dehydrogenase family)